MFAFLTFMNNSFYEKKKKLRYVDREGDGEGWSQIKEVYSGSVWHCSICAVHVPKQKHEKKALKSSLNSNTT